MQEEIARADRLTPYNATFGDVFQDFYTPFDDTELRLAPSANPTPDPNAKMCFKEVDVYGKCPQLLQRPVPKPIPGSKVCTTYVTGEGDGYTQQFGDVPYFGGFSPMVPSNALEPMHFGARPVDSALRMVKSGDIEIANGDVKLRLRASEGMAIDSIQFKKMQLLAKKPASAFTTAAFNIAQGQNQLAKRADEAGLLASGGTASKIVRRLASKNAAFTKVQAAHAARPGTIIDGKPVRHSVLSPYMVTKRVTVTQSNTVRYTAGVTTPTPFRNVRMSIPRLGLRPVFRGVKVLTRGGAWKNAPAKMTRFSAAKYSAIIVTDGKHAVGLKIVDAPKPKTFGSSFAHGSSYRIARGPKHTLVSVSQTLGSLRPKTKTLAPAGTYSVTTDFTFGSLQVVKRRLQTKKGKGKDKCDVPTIKGKVIKTNDGGVKIEYTVGNKKLTVILKKPGHGMKPGNVVAIQLDPTTGKVVKVRPQKRPLKRPLKRPIRVTPRPRPGQRAVTGTVVSSMRTKMRGAKPRYEIAYAFKGKQMRYSVVSSADVATGTKVTLHIDAKGGVKKVIFPRTTKPVIKKPAISKKPADAKKLIKTIGRVKEYRERKSGSGDRPVVGAGSTYVISYTFNGKPMTYEHYSSPSILNSAEKTAALFGGSDPKKTVGMKVLLHVDSRGAVKDILPHKDKA